MLQKDDLNFISCSNIRYVQLNPKRRVFLHSKNDGASWENELSQLSNFRHVSFSIGLRTFDLSGLRKFFHRSKNPIGCLNFILHMVGLFFFEERLLWSASKLLSVNSDNKAFPFIFAKRSKHFDFQNNLVRTVSRSISIEESMGNFMKLVMRLENTPTVSWTTKRLSGIVIFFVYSANILLEKSDTFQLHIDRHKSVVIFETWEVSTDLKTS